MDASFGQGGLTRLDFGRGDDVALALAARSDGLLVLAGYADNGQDEDFALARFTADGQLDSSFGGPGWSFGPAGTATTNLGPGDDRATTVAFLGTGKIVAGGFSFQDNNSTSGRNRDFALARYDAQGRLDPAFGTAGTMIADQAADEDAIGALLVQPDDRILVTGTVNAAGDLDKIFQRFNTDGSLDTTYAPNAGVGRTFISFGRANDEGFAVAVQPDDRIVVAGSAANDAFFAVARREGERGIRDGLFGTDGRVLTDIGPGKDIARALAIQPDGKILVAGSSEQDNGSPFGRNEDFALVRYNPNGSLDTTFGTGGKVTLDFVGWHDSIQAVVLLPNGQIVAAGSSGRNGSPDQFDFALARFNPDGSLDTTFGQAGKVVTDFGFGNDFATGLAVLPDGKIVVGGYAFTGLDLDFALARYSASGVLDTSFGTGGRVTTDFGFGDDEARGLAVQADGKLVLAGRATTPTNFDLALARYNPDGTLDTGFRDPDPGRTGTPTPDGTVTTDFNSNADAGNGLVIQADGRIVVVGTSANLTGRDFAAARYRPDGRLDTTFGNAGRTTVNIGDDTGMAVALAPDGQIVFAGSTNSSDLQKSGVVIGRLFAVALSDFPPVAVADQANTELGVPVIIPVLANDSDQDNHPLSISRFTQGGAGSVQLNADGTLTYTPEPGFTGTDRFTYTATDGELSAEATVTVQVLAAPPRLGAVLDGSGSLVVGERWLALSSATAAGVFQGTVGTGRSLRQGPFALLTNGDVSVATDNRNAGVNNQVRLRGAFDVLILELTLEIPPDTNYLSFDFSFLSNEYPLFRDRGFNDAFIAELDRTTWTVDPQTGLITAPDNFAFDARDLLHRPVSVHSDFFNDRRVVTLTGTLYNGGTPLLQAGTPITPGRHVLYLSLFDVGDGQIDSAVFLRNLVARNVSAAAATPGVHQPPIAVDDFVPFLPSQPVTLRVLDNDLSFDGAAFRLISVSPASAGRVDFDPAAGTVRYTPTGPTEDGGDSFAYTIQDAQGNTSTATVQFVPFFTTAASLSVGPTDPAVTTLAPGVSATLNNNTPGSDPTAVTVAKYSGNPGLATSAGSVSLQGASFFDVKVLGSDSSDRVVVSFAAPADGSQLLYWTGTGFEPVRSSGNTDPVRTADGRFLVVLDGTSRPRITGLTGTVFTVSVPVNNAPTPVTVTPPVVQGPSPSSPGGTDPGQGLGRTATFRSSAELSLALAPSQAGQLSSAPSNQTPGNNAAAGSTASAAPSGSTSGTATSGTSEETEQPSDEATFWRLLLGDEVYWLWLMGGDEVLYMWVRSWPAAPVPAAAPNPPAAPEGKPATPTPEEEARLDVVETLFAEALPTECKPTLTDETAPFVAESWIPSEMAAEVRTSLPVEVTVAPEEVAAAVLALYALAPRASGEPSKRRACRRHFRW